MFTFPGWLGFRAMRGILAMLRAKDIPSARRRGAALGERIYQLDNKWTNIAREQLQFHLDIKDDTELNALVLKNYQHYGMMLAELACFDRFFTETDEWFENTGTENIEYLADGGLVISAHLGNWELMGMHHTRHQSHVAALVKPINNPYVDQWINDIRKTYGVDSVITRDNARYIRQLLKKKTTLVTLADQNSLYHEGLFVPFFNKPASTHYGPAMLAIRAGVPVITAFSSRQDNGKFRIDYGSPIEYDKTASLREQTWQLTAALSKRVEDAIRQRPEQWFWIHRRWKNQPRADVPEWKYGPAGKQWVQTMRDDVIG